MAPRKASSSADPKEKKPAARRRRKKAEPASRGLAASDVGGGSPPAAIEALRRAVEKDGGCAIGAYRDPLGGNWHLLASLPIDKVSPTPFQRDLSEAHVKRLAGVLDKLDRFVDPILVVPAEGGGWWTPNGNHRTAAMRAIGGRSLVAVVIPDADVATKILALNTEKAHNLREKSLEVVRMARMLAVADPRPEEAFVLEFEEPAFLTLGLCYEKNGRFAGGAYHPLLKRIDEFTADKLPRALAAREKRAARILELDEAVNEVVKELKKRGFESPYLKAFVVARVNPTRFQRSKPEFDATLDKMLAAAKKFDAGKVRASQLAASGGAPAE
jgi:ParB family chromosome partitioning protein